MAFEIDPRVDFAFKRLFGVEANKLLLIDLVNAVLDPPAEDRIVEVTLRDPFNLRDFQEDKLSIVDVKVRDQRGRRFLIEMQMVSYPEVRKRFLYYWSKAYQEQLAEADRYTQLEPVILIVFLCESLSSDVDDYHRVYRLCDERQRVFTNDIEFHTIELAKFSGPPQASARQIDRWSWFLQFAKGHDMMQFPQEMLDDPIFQQAFRELAKMAQDPAQREAYERRLNNLREERTRAESFLRKGYNEGRSEGRVEERAAGLRHQIQFLERVLHLPTTSAEQLDSLSLCELEQRATELEERCLANGTNGQDAPQP